MGIASTSAPCACNCIHARSRNREEDIDPPFCVSNLNKSSPTTLAGDVPPCKHSFHQEVNQSESSWDERERRPYDECALHIHSPLSSNSLSWTRRAFRSVRFSIATKS